jgi:hypothetical protein
MTPERKETRLNKTRLNKTKLNKTKQNKTKQNKTKHGLGSYFTRRGQLNLPKI